ncbi:uncharacterized protein LOC115441630 [Manduca sexta]|uniref:uncharacterized protein LOC115441630 n=1 Tax=Manduca sexta TaxID=7130 RepID=UPI00188DD6EE|nr:uncharacterized protein LOC115441630 [Manduca sexta]
MAGADVSFTPSDLMHYAESLIRESRLHESRANRSNYSWLMARNVNQTPLEEYFKDLKPTLHKMTPESCTAIAVKLDNLSEYATTDQIVATFKKLLEEQYTIQIMGANIKRGKELKTRKVNKVHPVLGQGREATVSFVLHG